MEKQSGDVAMNLIGLILIAALSGGIVAVSLRLRLGSPSEIGDFKRPTEEG